MSEDLIKRSDAIKALYKYDFVSKTVIEREINALPSADRPQDDEFKNFDRESLILLIEAQKERIGELLADRPQGEWIKVTNGRGGHECSNCHGYAPSYMSGDEHLSDYCPYCGARMRPKLQGTHFDSIIIDECAMKGADDE